MKYIRRYIRRYIRKYIRRQKDLATHTFISSELDFLEWTTEDEKQTGVLSPRRSRASLGKPEDQYKYVGFGWDRPNTTTGSPLGLLLPQLYP